MNSTNPSYTPFPTKRRWRAFALRRRLSLFAFAALPIAGLILAASGGARLPSGQAPRAAAEARTGQELQQASTAWAVVDRFEPTGEQGAVLAVLLVGDEEAEYVLSASLLPEGASPGIWLRLRQQEGGVPSFEIDHERTRAARSRIEAKLSELRTRDIR